VPIKVALPKGRLLPETVNLLERADWRLSDYHKDTRFYRLKSGRFPELMGKMFNERDVPIQVAVGNHDLGICGLDWVEEIRVKYPSLALVRVRNLPYGRNTLRVFASPSLGVTTADQLSARTEVIRLVSEYPNLAESFALNLRLRRFSVLPVWGAAEVYPPENADLVLASGELGEFYDFGLVPISEVLSSSAYLIANRDSWETKDLCELVQSICEQSSLGELPAPLPEAAPVQDVVGRWFTDEVAADTVRLALPDGHQQKPTIKLLNKVGIQVDDYPSPTGNRRPTTNLPGVVVKVIRPQNMPLQVANGNFDLAITGRDWLREHLYQFPSSPVKDLLDLKFGWVRIVAVVSNELHIADVESLREFNVRRSAPLRIASEYVNIADKYARDNHLGTYRIIPTWGATEAFLPEDADLLVENTETGRTLARHNLNIIDTLFESTACLIGNTSRIASSAAGRRMESIVDTLRQALKES